MLFKLLGLLLIRLPVLIGVFGFTKQHYYSLPAYEGPDIRFICTTLVAGSLGLQILLIGDKNAWLILRCWALIGLGYLALGPFEMQEKIYAIPALSTPGTIWAVGGGMFCFYLSRTEGRSSLTGERRGI